MTCDLREIPFPLPFDRSDRHSSAFGGIELLGADMANGRTLDRW